MEFLDDRPPDCPRVFTLDDDGASCTVDDIFYNDIATLVGCLLSLPYVLVAEVAEDILYDVLELESREFV
ncbi:hypothetical protein C462_00042 [Halorubrum distributum JCM 13916]|uniref:Uncharacterized protein n=1 Tax=Halorubrum distributum JCM 13916 TaxID=1230455 RepID=M0PV84_9EURY|nr:hypothetical protein C462_00042 [Halorubrum arcis JCM 13916]